MKVRLAAVALLVAAGTASAALNAYRTGISLPQAIKLADGSVLPAGKYDVQIDYKGFGNAAELRFLQGGVFKGETPAEARGFPSQAPAGASAEQAFPKVEDKAGKTSPLIKSDSAFPKQPAANKSAPADAPPAFSWEKAGFRAGQKGAVTKAGAGKLKLSFDSVNSAAGFSAILPYVEQARKK